MLPSIKRALDSLGENIKLARLRRRISMRLLAARSGVSASTLCRIEAGNGTVSINSYTKVLHSLGLISCIEKLALDDELGRKLQDIELLNGADNE